MLSLFNEVVKSNGANGTTQLESTARLTALATTVVNDIMKAIENNNTDETTAAVKASMQSHEAMDKLISQHTDLTLVDCFYLKNLSDDELEKMVKSQQSKRSRSKSKVMTVDNYKTMMVGAVAENLLRMITGKGKSATTGMKFASVEFTEEDLQQLAMNQEELKKAIRNIQSKKSIMKSKANFDEASERWQQLLVAEEQLKGIRFTAPSQSSIPNRTAAINEILAGVEDVTSLKAADAKSLLERIQAAISN